MTVTSRKGWRKKRAQIEMDAVHLGYFLERNEKSRRETIGVHRTFEKHSWTVYPMEDVARFLFG